MTNKDTINENRRKWLAALRSGDYVQGQAALAYRDEDTGETRYCCLGVACDVLGIEGIVREGYRYIGFDGALTVLPETAQYALGLREEDPDTEQGTVSGLNDNGVSFTEIADVLEEYFRVEDEWTA